MMISWTNAYLKNLWAQIWVKWAKIGPKIKGFFDIFLKFGLLVFLEIAYDDSLEPCLTTRRTKTHEKNCGSQIVSEIRVFAIFSRFHY